MENDYFTGIWELTHGIDNCFTTQSILSSFQFDNSLELPSDDSENLCPYTDATDFLDGSCNLFAKMLHQKYGYKVHEISCDKGNHWFCTTSYNGQLVYIDVRGATTRKDEFFNHFEHITSSPFFCETVHDDSTMDFTDDSWKDTGQLFALWIIIEHEDYYKVPWHKC